MSNKTRVLHVRVVGFSAPERQMLNSIFLLSVAPARQIGYKLWNPEAGIAPDMYLLDGDSDSAVASWQATFSSTSDRTLVVGSKNVDLGVASAARPLGLKVVGAMDRLAIALQNAALNKESALHDVSGPRAGTLPTGSDSRNDISAPAAARPDASLPRSSTGSTVQQPKLGAGMNGPAPFSATAAGSTLAGAASAATLASAAHAALAAGAAGTSGTTASPGAGSLAGTAGTAASSSAGAAAAQSNAAAASTVSSAGAASTVSSAAAASPLSSAVAASTLSSAAAASTLSSAAAAATLSGSAATHVASSTLSSAAATAATPPMTATVPAATVLPHVTLQPSVAPPTERALEKSLNEKAVTEKAVERILADKTGEKSADKPALPPTSGATPLSPSALAAAVAPSAGRANLRVVPNPTPPLSASLPASARFADLPLNATATTPVLKPETPAAPAPAAAPPPAPVAPAAAIPTPKHEEHNFRVLAVDDSPLMRTFLQNKLQPYGISPEFASSGEEALFKISKQHFDMIFLDVMLPGMDGYDVCKMIKKNKDNNLMKVVMLTSKDKTFDKIRGTMAGCDGYLTKPVDELKLRAIIERHTVTRK